MKRVLLTGATGFIGRHTLPSLRERGYEVHAVSSRNVGRSGAGMHWHRADLLEAREIQGLVAEVRPTHLVHLAWNVEPGAYWTSPANLRWVAASLELVRSFAEGGGERAIFAGTCAEYNWSSGRCIERETPLIPATLYGTCKHSLQQMVTAYARETRFSVAWARIFFLFGPHERPGRLVPSVIGSLLRQEPARCTAGEQVRDFLHVADVADALVATLDSSVEGPINIASGTGSTVKEVVQTIAAALGREDLLHLGARSTPPGDPPLLIASVDRLRDEVGWQPRHTLRSGLHDTIAWWQHHHQPVSGVDQR